MIPLESMLRNPYGWDALKRSLRAGEVQIEELQQQLGLMTVKTLKPEPAPLSSMRAQGESRGDSREG